MPSTAPIAIDRDGHRTVVKWHRARRRASDPPFSASRIVEGMRLGASVEIDLVCHADSGFAVVHDLDLTQATTGTGRVTELGAPQLRALSLRHPDGTVRDEPVLLLDDLSALLDAAPIHPNALLQLDFKQTGRDLSHASISAFADALAPIARHVIVSCGDAVAVDKLTAPVPDIRIGYDPCHGWAVHRVLLSRRFTRFVDRAVAASPDAEMVYLERRLILGAARRGFDIVDAFGRRGRTVDAYTITNVDHDSLAQVRRLLALHVDQITTDDPEGLVAALG